MSRTNAQRKIQNYPETIGSLNMPEIQQVICAMECSSDKQSRANMRQALAERFNVSGNLIDWCSAHRTQALRNGSAWPYDG